MSSRQEIKFVMVTLCEKLTDLRAFLKAKKIFFPGISVSIFSGRCKHLTQ